LVLQLLFQAKPKVQLSGNSDANNSYLTSKIDGLASEDHSQKPLTQTDERGEKSLYWIAIQQLTLGSPAEVSF